MSLIVHHYGKMIARRLELSREEHEPAFRITGHATSIRFFIIIKANSRLSSCILGDADCLLS